MKFYSRLKPGRSMARPNLVPVGHLCEECETYRKPAWRQVILPSSRKWSLRRKVTFWTCQLIARWVGNAACRLSQLADSALLTAYRSIYSGSVLTSLNRD